MAVSWNEILSTDLEKLNETARALQVHPLALEDCIHRDQRPKLDDYDHHQLLVWFMLAKDEVHELQFLIFPDQLILVTHQSPPEGTSWFDFLRLSSQTKDVWHLLYTALDHATDITWGELRKLLTQVDTFEQRLFTDSFHPQSLLLVKNELNEVDFSIGHLSSVARQLQNLCHPKDDLNWKLRDLFDHCERINRSIELYRAQIATTIEMYWGLQANKTDRQVKKLTILASISVPLTFWSSFWGMNFEVIPFKQPGLFFVALVLMALSVVATVWLLIRKGYWD